MTHTTDRILEHYSSTGLISRIKIALSKIVPDGEPLTVDELAPLDQFHVRGMLATTELANAVKIEPSTRVLDVGCGLGGPARSLAAIFDCRVTGIDMSPDFIDAATYLTERCRLLDRVTFQVGDATRLPFEDAAFDTVFLQHVAMNIRNRGALYAEVGRVLAPGGRLATYDLIRGEGDVAYPVPWARDASTSFQLSERETRTILEQAGFTPIHWRDDTEIAIEWFKTTIAGSSSNGLSLAVVMGPDFRETTGNLARNLHERRLGLLSAVLIRD
jgi:SAM-dependent methyltransferase